ncbi:uroporphyrinogen-III synthase [Roseibacterium beibuensis]|uniref:Uroporphyrinogen-III synthase n=1 Tax=[Roseibacterium] beibuensis TaxID=1193142 RepID=A0ABP9LF60_9RHOB|nr:uroporphyrinogen-III synthase [Roseibacterium beibuensis]MCS6626569.1 uroporphyrinogen-III synthase [Roseibacterium beibuensis]
MSDNAKPLILLTRPKAQSERFARALRDRLGEVEVVIAPLMEVVPLTAPPEAAQARTLIFTSENAVPQAGAGAHRVAWCVGRRTALAAQKAGFLPISVDGTADDLVARLAHERPEGPIWHLHGTHVRGDIAGRLEQAGIAVHEAAVYDQRTVTPDPAFLAGLRRPGAILPIFSPRSAKLLAKAAGDRPPRLTLIAISVAARDALPDPWQSGVDVAESPNAEAILEEIARRIGA